MAFVRTGTFDVIVNGTRHRLIAGGAFITSPGLEFQCIHGQHCPDDVCLSIDFEPDAVDGAEHAWARAGWAARRMPTPRLAHVQRRLDGAAEAGDRFEMERWALAALTALRADARKDRARGYYAARQSDLDAVIAACRAIEANPERNRSVADLARNVGLTSTKLTHSFRRYVGMSPHSYVVRWRLASAAELLDEGASVSETCWRSGFENLSHFCRTFQRSFGARASNWRTIPLRERRRKVQALLSGSA